MTLKIKALKEKRNDLVSKMGEITDRAQDQLRAFTEDENNELERIDAEVAALDATIEKIESKRAMLVIGDDPEPDNGGDVDEVRAFASYLRSGNFGDLLRADNNFIAGTDGKNAAIVPKTIADRIIKKLTEVSPIYNMAQKWTVKGTLDLPYYDESTSAVSVSYANEFSTLDATAGEFKAVELTGYLAGALSKISRSLINSTDVALVDFVVSDIAEKIAAWIEGELLNGTTGKIEGLSTVKNTVTTAASTAITLDDLIDLQDEIIDRLQGGSVWIMNRKTRSLCRKLKDADGYPLLQHDMTQGFGHTILGHPVYTSDNMAVPEAGATGIYYGNMQGLAVKVSEQPAVEVLRELFALQHAVGAVAWFELDAKVQQEQALAKLVFKEA